MVVGKLLATENFSEINRPFLALNAPTINVFNMTNYPVAGACVTEAGEVTVAIGSPVSFSQTVPCVNDRFSLSATLTPASFYSDGYAVINLSQMSLNLSKVIPTDSIMITRWLLEDPELTITLSLISGQQYDFSVDWGDGTPLQIVTSFNDPNAIHTYTAAGSYDVRITGLARGWGSNLPTSYASGGCRINQVIQLGNMNWRNFRSGFFGCNLLTNFNSQREDVANVTSMEWMFRSSSIDPEVGHWNVSQVRNMGGMFESNSNANPDVSRWDVGLVTNMWSMFYRASNANPDVSDWDVSSLATATSLFDRAIAANPDVSRWDVSQVTNMTNMFRDSPSANPDTRAWNVANVTNFNGIFQGLTQTPGISNQRYSDFLNMVNSTSARNNLALHASQYYLPSASAARANLVGKGWTINDLGLQP